MGREPQERPHHTDSGRADRDVHHQFDQVGGTRPSGCFPFDPLTVGRGTLRPPRACSHARVVGQAGVRRDRGGSAGLGTATPTAAVGRVLALIVAIGVVLYVALTFLLGWMWEGYDPIRDTQSELGAVDSPYRTWMNIGGFMGLGVVILCFAAAYHLLLRDGIAKTIATALVMVAGVGMIVVGFFPCDAGCVDVTRTGELHGLWSMPGAIGLPLAAMLSASVFRTDGRFGTRWQAASFWIGLLSLVSGPIVALGWIEGVPGLLQRAGMWPSLFWMMAVSLRLVWLDEAHAAQGARV